MNSAALLAVGFGLLAAVSWGFGDFWAANASRRFGGLAAGVIINLIGTIIIDVVYLLWFRSHTTFDVVGWSWAIGSSLAFVTANLTFYKALEHGPVSIVSPLGAMYPVITALVLVALFDVQLHLRQSVGIVIVMLGVVAASGLFERVQNGRRFGRGPLLGLVAMLSWGLAWVCINQAVNRLGWQLSSVLELTAASMVLLPLLLVLRRLEPNLPKQLLPGLRSPLVLAAGVLTMCGFLLCSMGIDYASSLATVVVVLSACYPILTVILALRNLREKVQPVPLAGALVGVAGIVVLSLG